MSSKTTLVPLFFSNSGPYVLRTKSSLELSRCCILIDLPVEAAAGAAAAGLAPAAVVGWPAAAGLVGSAAAGLAPVAGAVVGAAVGAAAPEQAASSSAAPALVSARKLRRPARVRSFISLPFPCDEGSS